MMHATGPQPEGTYTSSGSFDKMTRARKLRRALRLLDRLR